MVSPRPNYFIFKGYLKTGGGGGGGGRRTPTGSLIGTDERFKTKGDNSRTITLEVRCTREVQ